MVITQEHFNRLHFNNYNENSLHVRQEKANGVTFSDFLKCSTLHSYEGEFVLRHIHAHDTVSNKMHPRIVL